MINFKVAAAESDGVDFPFTRMKNATGPTATDGTEFDTDLWSTSWGVPQAHLAAIGIAPSGDEDVADASEVLDAVVEEGMGRAESVEEDGTSAANVYVVNPGTTLTPVGSSTGVNGAPHSYFQGMRLAFDVAADNTGASTLNAFGLGVQNIKMPEGTDPPAGAITGRVEVVYDGTNFVLVGAGVPSGVASLLITGDAPSGTPAKNTLYTDSIIKAWIHLDVSAATITNNMDGVLDSFNISGVVLTSIGNFQVFWDRDFSNLNYCLTTMGGQDSDTRVDVYMRSRTTGSVSLRAARNDTNALLDIDNAMIMVIGDQA